jgi:hypothetical protein
VVASVPPMQGSCSLGRALFPTRRAKGFGLDLTACAAHAHHTHEKLSEAIVQFFDVREHMHGRMVLRAVMRPCSVTELAVTE